MIDSAFYVAGDGDFVVATEHTRGPWSPDHQHAGPPAALLARAVEAELPAEPAMQVVRLTFEILRPVPIDAVSVAVETLHGGRRVRLIESRLTDAEGRTLMRGRALAIRTETVAVPAVEAAGDVPVAPAQAEPFEFPFFTTDVGYHHAMELRLARGTWGQGPVACWMRMRLPLVAGEVPSPLQRVVTAADAGSGVSMVLDLREHTFMNPDLTVYLHRLPAGEWVCLDAATIPQGNGIGLADTRLLDERGAIGRCDQSLIIQPR